MARRAAAAFRDSRLLTLPEAGHVAMMEYPEAVAQAFRELLEDTGELGEPVKASDEAAGSAMADEAGPAGAGS